MKRQMQLDVYDYNIWNNRRCALTAIMTEFCVQLILEEAPQVQYHDNEILINSYHV